MLCICNIYDKSLQSGFFFYKNKGRPLRTILFGKSTVQTFVTLDTSTRYANKSETILHTKPVVAFLNRSSGIKRGQPHNTYNIIITDTKQRQHLCFFCRCPTFSDASRYSFNEATIIATINRCLTNKTKNYGSINNRTQRFSAVD